MFLGEFSCLGAFYAQRAWQRRQGIPVKPALPLNQMYIFLLPACCDMAGTSTMYIGLLLTYASFFQMLCATRNCPSPSPCAASSHPCPAACWPWTGVAP